MWNLAFGLVSVCDAVVRGKAPESYPCYDMASFDGDFIADGQVDVKDLSLMYRMKWSMEPGAQYMLKSDAAAHDDPLVRRGAPQPALA